MVRQLRREHAQVTMSETMVNLSSSVDDRRDDPQGRSIIQQDKRHRRSDLQGHSVIQHG